MASRPQPSFNLLAIPFRHCLLEILDRSWREDGSHGGRALPAEPFADLVAVKGQDRIVRGRFAKVVALFELGDGSRRFLDLGLGLRLGFERLSVPATAVAIRHPLRVASARPHIHGHGQFAPTAKAFEPAVFVVDEHLGRSGGWAPLRQLRLPPGLSAGNQWRPSRPGRLGGCKWHRSLLPGFPLT
jgi:hypothetical protein